MISDKGEQKPHNSNEFKNYSNNNTNMISLINAKKNPKIYKKYRKVSAIKKVSTLLRTIYTYTRFLPAYDLAQKVGFDYILEFKSLFDPTTDQNLSNLKKTFKHQIDINIGSISFSVKYVDKNEIFQMEQYLKSENGRISHHRFFSEKLVKPLEDSLELKKISSRSLDKYLMDKKEEESMINFSIISQYEMIDEKFILTRDFNDLISADLEKEKSELVKINTKIHELNKCPDCDYFTSEDSDVENLDCPLDHEEILEISEESQNFYLHEENEDTNTQVMNVIYCLKKIKKEIKNFPEVKINMINLYKYVHKN